jgi:16S rRNA processing protein RimM
MDTPRWDDLVVVARIARPHGLRGEVILNPETDFADERFKPGNRVFMLDGAQVVPIVVRSVFFHRLRPVVGFDGFDAIEQVGALVGRELRIEAADLQPLPAGMFYHHDLVGCRVETTQGAHVGAVTKVDGSGDATRLVVDGASGELLIPLAVDICRTIDPGGRRIVIDALDGLLDLNIGRSHRVRRGRRW